MPLIDKQAAIDAFPGGVYTKRMIDEILRDLPNVPARPKIVAALERRKNPLGGVVICCTKCDWALPVGLVPGDLKHCPNCTARFIRFQTEKRREEW